jgi:hypothetical protein
VKDVPEIHSVFGVDFSGARLAGRTTWVARCEVRGHGDEARLHLVRLASLERLAGSAERLPALAHLVAMVRASGDALWALDAPLGLPVELFDGSVGWSHTVRLVREWAPDGAYDLGLWCLARARERGLPQHVYRATDRAARAPFDPYHYRIIYQTFHAIRDVAAPLARTRETAVLPFQYRRLGRARRVLVETCPSSTLKRLGLPHQNYKQPEGGPLAARRLRTRRAILAGLAPLVEIWPEHRRLIMRDPGGDALDAVICAAGAFAAWRAADHVGLARDRRAGREGFLYA